MRILGVDPGLTRCGLGVVESGASRRVTMLDVRVATSPSTLETPARLAQIATVLEAMLDEHQPEAVAMERIFARSDVSTIMGTAQVSGVIMLAAERRGLPLSLYTPSEVKAAVTGNGRADKAQVTFMVTRLLGLSEAPRPADAADALAIAIAHAWRGGAAPTGSAATTPAQRRWAEAEKAARRRG